MPKGTRKAPFAERRRKEAKGGVIPTRRRGRTVCPAFESKHTAQSVSSSNVRNPKSGRARPKTVSTDFAPSQSGNSCAPFWASAFFWGSSLLRGALEINRRKGRVERGRLILFPDKGFVSLFPSHVLKLGVLFLRFYLFSVKV